MVVTVNYGDSGWAIGIGTNVPGTDTEAAAVLDAGTAIFILAESVDFDIEQKDKIMDLPAGYNIAIKLGKRFQSIKISKGRLITDPAHTSDTGYMSANRITEFLMGNQEASDAPLYLVARRDSKSKSFYNQTTKHFYLRGYAKKVKISDKEPGHTEITLEFKEAWN